MSDFVMVCSLSNGTRPPMTFTVPGEEAEAAGEMIWSSRAKLGRPGAVGTAVYIPVALPEMPGKKKAASFLFSVDVKTGAEKYPPEVGIVQLSAAEARFTPPPCSEEGERKERFFVHDLIVLW
jgi:hypothetical protein